MKIEQITEGYCIQSGDKFANKWVEPQFTSYFLGEFEYAHVFELKIEADKVLAFYRFPNGEIKKIRTTMIKELI